MRTRWRDAAKEDAKKPPVSPSRLSSRHRAFAFAFLVFFLLGVLVSWRLGAINDLHIKTVSQTPEEEPIPIAYAIALSMAYHRPCVRAHTTGKLPVPLFDFTPAPPT